MANTIAYAQIFQKSLDKQILQQSTSGFLEANAGQVQYDGGNTVKIPVIDMDGMGDYSRTTGYVDGSVNLTYEDFTMTQDRGRSFTLDSMDVNESNFVAAAGMVMGEFQRDKVIPEIDSYRWSKIYSVSAAKGNSTTYTLAKTTILDQLEDDINAVKDIVGDTNGLVIVMAIPASSMLNKSYDKKLDVVQFTGGQIYTTVKGIDGIPILPVTSSRMKTLYTKYDGKTSGQEAGGLVPNAAAKQINWLIFPRTAPIAVSKQDMPRIFEPAVNQNADAWKINYRKYHDLWIPTNKAKLVRSNIGA